MTQQPRQSIQHCPVCGIAMLGSKSNENSAGFDSFNCLRCHAVMTVAARAGSGKPDKKT